MKKEELLEKIKEMWNEETGQICFLNVNGIQFCVLPDDIDTIWSIYEYIPNVKSEMPDIVNQEIIRRNLEQYNDVQRMRLYHYAVAYALWLKFNTEMDYLTILVQK